MMKKKKKIKAGGARGVIVIVSRTIGELSTHKVNEPVIQHNSPPIILTSNTYHAYTSNEKFIFLIMQRW